MDAPGVRDLHSCLFSTVCMRAEILWLVWYLKLSIRISSVYLCGICPLPLLFLAVWSWKRCGGRHAQTRSACIIWHSWEVVNDYLHRWWLAVYHRHLSCHLYMKYAVTSYRTCIQTPIFHILYLLWETSSSIHTGGWRSLMTYAISFLWKSFWKCSSKWHSFLSLLMLLE